MKRLLVIAAAMTLFVPALALAQQNQPHKGGGKPAPHATPHAAPHAAPHGTPRAGGSHGGPRGPHGGPHVSQGHRPPHGGPGRHGHVAGGRPNYGHGVYHGPRGNRFWHNGRYYGRVHGGPWAWPHGYGYHRYYVGGILPSIFLGSAFIYADYLALGLAAPEPGFVWVRYGPDLVLVNQVTGQIVDVAYGVFM